LSRYINNCATRVYTTKSKDFAQLRQNFDAHEAFVAGGHAIRGSGRSSHRERVEKTPEWANSDLEVRKLLLMVFPKLATDERQRKSAGVWNTVIYMYFRLGYTRLYISLLMKWSPPKVNSTIRHIRRAMNGQTVKGKIRTGKKPGRPKKIGALLGATNGS
jgi:hypothetical protein